ncbi:P-loop containing nucleoside triphosphate hydrolase protein [Phaeosphaeria sp. MPI-PUGE-AT-0046c]|nr:P-loop containing nucleoside triphosphate hydrolase protein [Phaeosphaeria sp. MPI-PUGE-AT-0046c]
MTPNKAEKMSSAGSIKSTSRRGSLQYPEMPDAASQIATNNQNQDHSLSTTSTPVDAVLFMGLTGSGKSTLISLLADEAVQVGHDLSSCTSEARGYVATIDGHCTLLLDTPGFDDTDRTDFDIVSEIATGLHLLYVANLNVRGVIYVQRITDTRMSGASRRSLEILDSICGIPASANITFVTTMWDKLGPDADTKGMDRTEEMKKLFLASFIERGAQVGQHNGTAPSAQNIIRNVLARNQPVLLELQRENELQNLTLEQTGVGKILRHDIQRQQNEYDAELKDMEQQLLEAQRCNDRAAIELLTEDVERQKESLRRLEESRRQLNFGVQQLGEMKHASLEREFEEARKLDLAVGQDVNDDIRARIRRTTQRTRSLQNDQHWEEQSFQQEKARLQHASGRRDRERLTLQKARRHAEREVLRRRTTRTTGLFWEVMFQEVYHIRQY